MRVRVDLTGEIYEVHDLPAARNSVEDEWRISQSTGIAKTWRTLSQRPRLDRRAVVKFVVPHLSHARKRQTCS